MLVHSLFLLCFFVARFGQSRARSVECPLDGPIAQSVEQLAFNQWVAGSSPARLTISINNLGQRFDIEVAALLVY